MSTIENLPLAVECQQQHFASGKPRYPCVMRKFVAIAAFLSLAAAQETRREVTNSSGPAADNKANSSQVPDAYAVASQFERVLIFRFKYETDLLAGMEEMVKQNKIRNAVILAGAGSVKSYQVHQVSNRTF